MAIQKLFSVTAKNQLQIVTLLMKDLNRDDGGLLPDAYLHLVRKKAAN